MNSPAENVLQSLKSNENIENVPIENILLNNNSQSIVFLPTIGNNLTDVCLLQPTMSTTLNSRIIQNDITAAIDKLQRQSIVSVGTISSSSITSTAFINMSPCFKNTKFRRILQSIFLGQIMSLCLCGSGVASQFLVEKNFKAPAAQSLLSYFFLAFIYGVIIFFRPGDKQNFGTVLQKRGLKYILLALIDFEANYLIVYAYQFTNLTSIQLLNCFTIPVVMLLSWLFLSVRYIVTHIVGVAICLLGVAFIIYFDATAGSDFAGGKNRILGDVLCLSATILYAFANVSEEFLIKENDRSEYLGMIGLFGFIISGVQLAVLESNELATFQWSSSAIIYYLLFTFFMFLFYSLVSIVMQKTSALMFNLSILTASFYSFLAGVYLFHISFQITYVLSFVTVLIGSTIFAYNKTKEMTRQDRKCFCQFVDFFCSKAMCCCICRPPKSTYTVQDVQADHFIPSLSMDIRSEFHSS